MNTRIGDFMEKTSKNKNQEDHTSQIFGYVKLLILFAVTIFLVLFIRNLYLSKVNYRLMVPVISETIHQEINQNEVYNFVRENSNVILYIGAASDSDCRTFEIDFNRIIKEKNLEDVITYLNLEKETNSRAFFKEFNKFYNTSLKRYPVLVVFESGNVESFLEISVGDDYESEIVSNFLDLHWGIEQ